MLLFRLALLALASGSPGEATSVARELPSAYICAPNGSAIIDRTANVTWVDPVRTASGTEVTINTLVAGKQPHVEAWKRESNGHFRLSVWTALGQEPEEVGQAVVPMASFNWLMSSGSLSDLLVHTGTGFASINPAEGKVLRRYIVAREEHWIPQRAARLEGGRHLIFSAAGVLEWNPGAQSLAVVLESDNPVWWLDVRVEGEAVRALGIRSRTLGTGEAGTLIEARVEPGKSAVRELSSSPTRIGATDGATILTESLATGELQVSTSTGLRSSHRVDGRVLAVCPSAQGYSVYFQDRDRVVRWRHLVD